MKIKAGIWIDHRQAVIVLVKGEEKEIIKVQSNVEKHLSRKQGARAGGPYERRLIPADDMQERGFKEHLVRYYDQVISNVQTAEALFIFGPSEAKNELKKRIEEKKVKIKILGVEAADKMTDGQIVAKVAMV